MDLLIGKTKLIEVELKPGSSNVRVFLSTNEVKNQFKQWDIKGQVGYLIEEQVALLTKLIVMKQLQFNKKHNIPNNGEIIGSLGVVGSGVTGQPKHVVVGKSFYDSSKDDSLLGTSGCSGTTPL